MTANEQNLVNDLVSTNRSINPAPLTIIVSNVKVQNDCDLRFLGTIPHTKLQKHFCLEAKSHAASNCSNNVLLLFGDILKNRKLKKIRNASYGVLLEYDSNLGMKSYFIDRIQKSFNSNDWDRFGKKYGCKYIFFYDGNTHELYYSKWGGFVTARSIQKWF